MPDDVASVLLTNRPHWRSATWASRRSTESAATSTPSSPRSRTVWPRPRPRKRKQSSSSPAGGVVCNRIESGRAHRCLIVKHCTCSSSCRTGTDLIPIDRTNQCPMPQCTYRLSPNKIETHKMTAWNPMESIFLPRQNVGREEVGKRLRGPPLYCHGPPLKAKGRAGSPRLACARWSCQYLHYLFEHTIHLSGPC